MRIQSRFGAARSDGTLDYLHEALAGSYTGLELKDLARADGWQDHCCIPQDFETGCWTGVVLEFCGAKSVAKMATKMERPPSKKETGIAGRWDVSLVPGKRVFCFCVFCVVCTARSKQ